MLVSATGMTLVILTGGIDLSVGAAVAFTTMLISWMRESGVSPWIAVIATLAGMFFARGACYVISVESISILNPHLMELAKWKLRFGAMKGAPFVSLNVIIAIVVVFVGIYLSLYTKFGRNIYAIGGNEQSALLLGIPIKRTKILVYTLNGFCSALSGVVFSLYMLSGYGQHCVGMEMDVIAAVVIGGTLLSGGTGYVFGTMFGVLTLGIIQTWINYLNINSWWTKITVGLLLLIFIVLQRMIVAVAKKKE
jgi:simple sugar transport system permease protein